MDDPHAPDSIIDGRYRVLQRHGFDGLAWHYQVHDIHQQGTPVVYHLLWYCLSHAQAKAFEPYRQLLRQLAREQLAALVRVVARPASYYAVWCIPEGSSRRPKRLPARLEEPLREAGYHKQPRWLAFGSPQSGLQLYGLAFAHSQPGLPRQSLDPYPLRRWLVAWVPACLLLALAGYVAYLSVAHYVARPLLVVPALEGQSLQEATVRLQQLGLRPRFEVSQKQDGSSASHLSTGNMTTDTTATGDAVPVLAMVPAAGSSLRSRAEVTLYYPPPPHYRPLQQVPNVLGSWAHRREWEGMGSSLPASDTATTHEALVMLLERRLAAAGLQLGNLITVPAAIAARTVLAQQPPPGSALAAGGVVDVVVSSGLPRIQTLVPDLRGLSLSQARSWAQLAGLQQRLITEEDTESNHSAGTVLAQNIQPYQLVDPEQVSLRLQVSARPQSTRWAGGVPDITGMTLEQARAFAERNGIALSTHAVRQPQLPVGVVLQRPAPGEPAREGLAGMQAWVNIPPYTPSAESLLLPPSQPPSSALQPAANSGDIYVFSWQIGQLRQENVLAEVQVTLPDGQVLAVARERVTSHRTLSGSWRAPYGVPLVFSLYVDGVPYGTPLNLSPR